MQLSWLENEHLRLGYAVDCGPELLHLSLAGREENLLALSPGVRWATPHGAYTLRGGHRLWAAPESDGRADIPSLSFRAGRRSARAKNLDVAHLLCRPSGEKAMSAE